MAGIEDREAVITIKVKLESDVVGLEGATVTHDPSLSDVSPEVSETTKETIKETVNELTEDAIKETFGMDTSGIENMTDMINKLDKQGINELTQFAKNPHGYMENGFIGLIEKGGPYGKLVLAIITTIVAVPELFKVIIDMLAVKGGPLNQDFRYSLDEQENQQFERVIQYRRLTGDDPVITVTTKGFIVGDPDFVGNSLIDADISRTARIGLRESSLGIIDGI